jgi:hypothetical protein
MNTVLLANSGPVAEFYEHGQKPSVFRNLSRKIMLHRIYCNF